MATNFEFYKDEILEAVKYGSQIAIKDNKPVKCSGMKCNECDFEKVRGECNPKRFEWLYAEHIEQTKLTKRERAFCEEVQTGWIARDEIGGIYWYANKPRRGSGEWFSKDIKYTNILFFKLFNFIKWEDEKPWLVEDLLKLEVMEDEQNL